MIFEQTRLGGAYLLKIEPRRDDRGMFARTFCASEFKAHGLPEQFVQCNVSCNAARGTLRGMHFQHEPRPEGKVVRCTAGAIWDVIVDLRKHSPTYCRWQAFELSSENRNALYVPPGFAHGFQTLTPNAEVFYQMTEFYAPELAGGVRWNDPAFGIEWPLPDPVMSDKDRSYQDYVA